GCALWPIGLAQPVPIITVFRAEADHSIWRSCPERIPRYPGRMRPAAALFLLAACGGGAAGGADAGTDAPADDAAGADAAAPLAWYAGAIRALPALEVDLVPFVDDLEHPDA